MKKFAFLFVVTILLGFAFHSQGTTDHSELTRCLSFVFGDGFWLKDPLAKYPLPTINNLESNKEYQVATDAINRNPATAKLRARAMEDFNSRSFEEDRLTQFEPLPVYKWGYALYCEGARATDLGKEYWNTHEDELDMVEWLLAALPQPRSSEYVRLQLLIRKQRHPFNATLAEMGRRLLAKNPSDLAVKRALARHLAKSKQEKDFNEAQQLANELVATNPKSISFLCLKLSTIAGKRYERFRGTITEKLELDRLIGSLVQLDQLLPSSDVKSDNRQHLSMMRQLRKRKFG